MDYLMLTLQNWINFVPFAENFADKEKMKEIQSSLLVDNVANNNKHNSLHQQNNQVALMENINFIGCLQLFIAILCLLLICNTVKIICRHGKSLLVVFATVVVQLLEDDVEKVEKMEKRLNVFESLMIKEIDRSKNEMIKVLTTQKEEMMQSDKLFLQTYDDHLRKFLSIVEKFEQLAIERGEVERNITSLQSGDSGQSYKPRTKQALQMLPN